MAASCMNELSNYINELKTAEAFSKQALVFDATYNSNTIIRYKRKRVREHLLKLFPSGSSILELNCGTGEDALFLGKEGYYVHATDVSEGMILQLKQKAAQSSYAANITTEICSFNQLQTLSNKGPFDAIFSNFGGLNCTSELERVLHSFAPLLKPNGLVTLVIIPPFCLWETFLMLKGNWKTATRRFFSSNGRTANVEGISFKCWYYPPSFVIRQLMKDFVVEKLEGLCTLVPPSYMEGFAEKYPGLYRFLVKKEDRLKEKWPWRSIGDYFIISLRKKS
jgi:ubiquinone/menaquinone biosynthesis C-methylase UbiE